MHLQISSSPSPSSTIAETAEAKVEAYKQYIEYEKKNGDPARVQLIIERFIAESPLSTEAWLLLTDHQVTARLYHHIV